MVRYNVLNMNNRSMEKKNTKVIKKKLITNGSDGLPTCDWQFPA